MTQEFKPEFIEVVLYDETKMKGDDRIQIKLTQHHECIFMIELQHWNYRTEEDISSIRQLIYAYRKNDIIRLTIEAIDEYYNLYLTKGVEEAHKNVYHKLKSYED